jgi:hypothetical protein
MIPPRELEEGHPGYQWVEHTDAARLLNHDEPSSESTVIAMSHLSVFVRLPKVITLGLRLVFHRTVL